MMRITRILILVAMFFFSVSGQALHAGNETTTRKKELQRIKREMREKKKEIKRADKRERSILTDLDRIDREIQADKAALTEQQKFVRDAEHSLKDVEKNDTEIRRELERSKQIYAQRLRALYKMSRSGYAAAIFVPAGQGDPAKRIKYLAVIAERDRTVIRDYGNALEKLASQQAEISDKKAHFRERKQAIEIKKSELETQKRKKALLLASVRKEKGIYEQTLHELEESSTNLWAMMKKAEQERKTAKAAQPRLSMRPPVDSAAPDGRLPWPVEGQVITRFGMQQHPQFKTMVFRRGIEIAAHEGEPVRVVSNGEVAYADWYKGYGKLMIIEHGPRFYSLYGNLSRIDLKKGDSVVKGQVIGLAGDTGSLKGAKLYFEIRRDGEAQDPLLWLKKR